MVDDETAGSQVQLGAAETHVMKNPAEVFETAPIHLFYAHGNNRVLRGP